MTINPKDLHLFVIDVEARKLKQNLNQNDEVPLQQYFTFLIRYKNEEVWNVYVSQVTPKVFTSLSSHKPLILWNRISGIPKNYQSVFVALSQKYTKDLRLLTYITGTTSDQLEKNDDNYLKEYGCTAVWKKAGFLYEAPVGWYGIDVIIDEERKKEILNHWNVVFHCTSALAVVSILMHRTMALPGDTLLDGSVLKIPEGHISGENYIFGSPCLSYCEYGYAQVCESASFQVKFALQLRMNPGTFVTQGDTLKNPKEQYHPCFANQEIEWVNPSRDDVVVTRIWMKIV